MANCTGPDPLCIVGKAAGSAVSKVAGNAFESLTAELLKAFEKYMGFIIKGWLGVPDPTLQGNPALGQIETSTQFILYALAMFGLLFAIGKVVLSLDSKAFLPALFMILKLVLVMAIAIPVITLLLESGTLFSVYIVERATGSDPDTIGKAITGGLSVYGAGGAILPAIIGLLGTLGQILFMILRGALLVILVAFLPLLAAGSGFEQGNQAFKRAIGWILALVLYKPVAAIIYALGIWMIKGDAGNPRPLLGKNINGFSEAQNTFFNAMLGLLVIILAVLALPALIKFIAPNVMGAGTSMLSSGAAVVGAGVAAGAAVVSLGGGLAAGGAGAAAAGGKGAAAAGSTASSTGGAVASLGGKGSGPESGGGSGGVSGAVNSGPSGGGQGTDVSPSSGAGTNPPKPSGNGPSAVSSAGAGAGAPLSTGSGTASQPSVPSQEPARSEAPGGSQAQVAPASGGGGAAASAANGAPAPSGRTGGGSGAPGAPVAESSPAPSAAAPSAASGAPSQSSAAAPAAPGAPVTGSNPARSVPAPPVAGGAPSPSGEAAPAAPGAPVASSAPASVGRAHGDSPGRKAADAARVASAAADKTGAAIEDTTDS